VLFRADVGGVPRFVFSWEQEGCPRCAAPLQVRLTRRRMVHSTRYGTFLAVERQGHCPQHRQLAPARCEQLARLVAPGSNHAYDVLVRVGMARFLECRQDEQIRDEICRQHGIELGRSTVSYLARKFVAYVQVVHQESIAALRGAMDARGGYILHIDGTCEEASRVLLVCMDSLSVQVLESRKIQSESHDQVRDVLRGVRRDWGLPLAIVHDLRRALITAADEVFPGVRQFVCHYHLAADVGKDILSAKDLRQRCTAESAKGVVHALGCWILAFAQDGEGYGVPFDLPYLNFYERIVEVHQMLEAAAPLEDERRRGPLRELNQLQRILDVVVAGDESPELRQIVAETKRDQRIFERFRKALRICPKGGKKRRHDEGAPSTSSAKRHRRVLQNLRTSLTRQARAGGASARTCKIIRQHLEKYWEYLFGHVLRKRGRKIVVPRTNNDEERLFGIVKRQCRRLHGRKDLSYELEAMSPAVPLLQNLSNRDYCETVYGGSEPEHIADRFSRVDPEGPAGLLQSWRQERLLQRIPRKLEKLRNLPKQVARFISMVIKELHD
jgi:hypothetical protein